MQIFLIFCESAFSLLITDKEPCKFAFNKRQNTNYSFGFNQSNISRDFSLQLSKRLADSDLAVIGLSGIGPIRKISVLDWFLPY
jgi:hypothetical protein